MLDIPNETTLAIHITTNCKFNCYGCFNHNNEKKNIDLEYIKLAMEKMKPERVLFFGGECVLEPELLRKAIDICNVEYVINTTGIYSKDLKDIYDNAYRIGLTIDSFDYEWLRKNKRFSVDDYNNYLELISRYQDKISMIHNIYPSHNDKNFFRDIKNYNLTVDNFPFVFTNQYQEFLSVFRDNIKIQKGITDKPKLRMLVDGTITRDMRGIYNLAHISDFEMNDLESYQYNQLPLHEKCKRCNYYGRCFACNIFPSFCKDVLDRVDYEPHFCRFTKIYFKYR